MAIVIKVENLSKQYRLGEVGTGTISHDLNRWWHRIRGKEDPYLRIGESNDRSQKGSSEYVWALRDINFEVQQGEVLGIIGKNGAGKSTLLKILSKVSAPSVGSIKAKGRIASLLEVGTGFHPELTGRENIYLNGTILGMTKREVSAKLDEIVDFAGVERYLDTPVKRYSSGMMVRLGFAVAAHLEPEILVVDEVLAVGDAEFQKKAVGKMQEVSQKGGRTVLFVSHNMESIEKLCPTALYLDKGEDVSYGATKAIVKEYLQAANSALSSKWTRNKPINPFASFLSATIINSKGQEISVMGPNEDGFMLLKIQIHQNIHQITFAFEVLTIGNQSVFCSHEKDTYPSKLAIGTYSAKIPIPKLLRTGTYKVNLGSNLSQFDSVEFFESVLTFEVRNDYHIMSGRPGLLHLPLNWEISK